jgi:hypothetical protein
VDGALGPLKKANAKLAFKRLYLLRKRRLRNSQTLCCPAEMQFLSQHSKTP